MAALPEPRLLRLKQIIGDLNATPPIEPLIPVGRSTLLGWVQDKKFPQPTRIGRCTVWHASDVSRWIEQGGKWEESDQKAGGSKQ